MPFCMVPSVVQPSCQVPACRARGGCWTESSLPFDAVSVGFMSLEAGWFSVCHWAKQPGQGEGAACWCTGAPVNQGQRDSRSGAPHERRFSALGHSHSLGAPDWQKRASLCSGSKISVQPNLWEARGGDEGEKRREGDHSWVFSPPHNGWLIQRTLPWNSFFSLVQIWITVILKKK